MRNAAVQWAVDVEDDDGGGITRVLTDCRGPWILAHALGPLHSTMYVHTLIPRYCGISPCWGVACCWVQHAGPRGAFGKGRKRRVTVRRTALLSAASETPHAQAILGRPEMGNQQTRPKSAVACPACAVSVGQKEADGRRNFFLQKKCPPRLDPRFCRSWPAWIASRWKSEVCTQCTCVHMVRLAGCTWTAGQP